MSPTITLEALTVLQTIQHRGSYAAAAEELNKVPSALSYIVQKLEEQLGLTIFQKQGRRSVLTPAGKHLVEEGKLIIAAVDALSEQAKNIANGWESKIRIAIDSMFNSNATFKVLNLFLQQYPDIEIDIREEVMSGAWEALIDDEVDLLLGAAGPVPQHKGIHAVPIARLDRVFVVSPEHPLVKAAQPIPYSRIAEERTVVVHDSARTSIPWSIGIIKQHHNFYVPTVDCKIRAQLAGIGCGYLPRQRIRKHIDQGELIPLEIERTDEQNPEMFMAWKIVNRGKGIKTLKELFIAHQNELLESC